MNLIPMCIIITLLKISDKDKNDIRFKQHNQEDSGGIFKALKTNKKLLNLEFYTHKNTF